MNVANAQRSVGCYRSISLGDCGEQGEQLKKAVLKHLPLKQKGTKRCRKKELIGYFFRIVL